MGVVLCVPYFYTPALRVYKTGDTSRVAAQEARCDHRHNATRERTKPRAERHTPPPYEPTNTNSPACDSRQKKYPRSRRSAFAFFAFAITTWEDETPKKTPARHRPPSSLALVVPVDTCVLRLGGGWKGRMRRARDTDGAVLILIVPIYLVRRAARGRGGRVEGSRAGAEPRSPTDAHTGTSIEHAAISLRASPAHLPRCMR